jgi:hypothetical protein
VDGEVAADLLERQVSGGGECRIGQMQW